MTIAACYLCPEGLVLGADSTSSALISSGSGLSGFHFYNHNQKLFELGESSTLGVVTWGLASLGAKSHREMFALLADDIKAKAATSVQDVAQRLARSVWAEYRAVYADVIRRCKALAGKKPHDANAVRSKSKQHRTKDEEEEFRELTLNLNIGYCVGGYCLPNRSTTAFEIMCSPLAGTVTPRQLPALSYKFWGMPKLVHRLIFGADDALIQAILSSGKWHGTPAELVEVLKRQRLGHHLLPIRDAVDFVHTCIYSTIKAMKFSNLFQICGGPIELAIITSDRKFRWVTHKSWSSAIHEGYNHVNEAQI